ncbi:MAG: class I SAM-dependent methyltransferase [Eubacteriales bacterium]|nr:class I SAM-dependent methyltransferase [Eubacteriales bacterium]
MIREIDTGNTESVLDETLTRGLGSLCFFHPAGTFSVTPASDILFRAIVEKKDALHGIGIDWGSGVGCQAILAARIPAVKTVYGLEISEKNIQAAIQNAKENKVERKVRFILSDSYDPYCEIEKREVSALKGKVDFIVSNPPSSEGDDGFGFRRIVLNGAREFLKRNGVVLLNVSFQYGAERVRSLVERIPGFQHLGVAASTQIVPFDLSRPDLLTCLKNYAKEEQNGGMKYTFYLGQNEEDGISNACRALRDYEDSGAIPYTKWQTQMFEYIGG